MKDGTFNTLAVGECSDFVADVTTGNKMHRVNAEHGWLMGTSSTQRVSDGGALSGLSTSPPFAIHRIQSSPITRNLV